MTKAAACLDSNRFWLTPLPLEKSSQTVGKGGPLPSPAVHYAQQKQRQRLLLRVLLQRVLPTLSKRFRPSWLKMAIKKINVFFSSVADPGYSRSRIQQQKRRGEKNFLFYIFWKFNKIVNSCIFKQVQKKNWSQLRTNKELKSLLPKTIVS